MFRNPNTHHKGLMVGLFIGLIVTLLLMAALRKCSIDQLPPYPDTIAGGDTINVAIELSPIGVTSAGDSLSGYYYNLLRNLSAAHPDGPALKFHPYTSLQQALRGLSEGKYQVVVGDIPVTSELKQGYRFIPTGLVDKQVLVQKRDSAGEVTVKTPLDLAGKNVVVPADSPFIARLRNLSREIGDSIHITADDRYSAEVLILKVETGEIDRVVAGSYLANSIAARYPDLDTSVIVSFNQFRGWAVANEDTTTYRILKDWLK